MRKLVRVVLIALASAAALALIYYGVLVFDTRGVMADARAAFLRGETGHGKLDMYTEYANREETADVHLSLFRIFTWHNFQHGYILVNYTCKAVDAAGNTVCSSRGIDSCWEIEKTDGRWEVVGILEAP